MAIRLGDDGTMDTVLECSECGEEFRFNFDPDDGEAEGEAAYDDFVDRSIAEVEAEHECNAEYQVGAKELRERLQAEGGSPLENFYSGKWKEADEASEARECPVCDGEAQVLGVMGRVTHYRCRNCGMDSSVEVVN